MTEKQLHVIVGVMAGMQAAIVHLSNVVAHHSGISPEELAESFEETASAIPEDVANRELMQLSVRQVAAGIRSSGAGPEFDALMARLLH